MMGVKTRIVNGSYDNIKITTREDLVFAKAIIEKQLILNVEDFYF